MADLVEYLVVVVPDESALAALVPALAEMVRAASIRILDLAAVVRDGDGAISVREPEAVESLAGLRDVDGEVGGLLSERDVELAGLALEPGTAGLVVLTEDRWAAPLSEAARGVGGRIVAGERIPRGRIVAPLAERARPAPEGG